MVAEIDWQGVAGTKLGVALIGSLTQRGYGACEHTLYFIRVESQVTAIIGLLHLKLISEVTVLKLSDYLK